MAMAPPHRHRRISSSSNSLFSAGRCSDEGKSAAGSGSISSRSFHSKTALLSHIVSPKSWGQKARKRVQAFQFPRRTRYTSAITPRFRTTSTFCDPFPLAPIPRRLTLDNVKEILRNPTRASNFLRPSKPTPLSKPIVNPGPIWLLGVMYSAETTLPSTVKLQALYGTEINAAPSSELAKSSFCNDFTSKIWMTHRSHFPAILNHISIDSDAWTSDAGWGCMLRTGQSLLANALVQIHLGREWRRPTFPTQTTEYATYLEIVTWFLDTPSPAAPFSIHRLAAATQEFGMDIGHWAGPSLAAGAIKALVDAYPEAGLGISLSLDGTVFQSDVYIASHGQEHDSKEALSTWGSRPVILLLCVRMGMGVLNPSYFNTIKDLFTYSQFLGIAGGCPKDSRYYIGCQDERLLYLDPHKTRPAIPVPSSRQDQDTSTVSWSPFSSSVGPSRHSSGPKSCGAPLVGDDQNAEDDITASPTLKLESFHCNTVRSTPLSQIYPDMLLGFLCKNEQDWKDFRERVQHVAQISVQDGPPPQLPERSLDNIGVEMMALLMVGERAEVDDDVELESLCDDDELDDSTEELVPEETPFGVLF